MTTPSLRNRIIRVLGVVVAYIALCALVLAGWLTVLEHGTCSDDVMREVPSPTAKYVAVLMERNCGAMTPYAYHINVRQVSHRFVHRWDGRVLDGEIVASNSPPYFAWSGSDELTISPRTKLFHPQPVWRNVRIRYTGEVN